jgi:branched-subunit amino acid transport protein
MSEWQSWGVVIGLALGTFLIRYSFIGLFANRDIPRWLEHALKFMVPAIFAAIVFSSVAVAGGRIAGLEQWPRYAAALIALFVAVKNQGNLVWTVVCGMVALHALTWLAQWLPS